MASTVRIALIHATTVAIDPIVGAMAAAWPGAEAANILDDSLSGDRAQDSALKPELAARIQELARYAETIGSAGILFTCSAFGPAIEQAARERSVPVLKPNEGMFDAALALGPRCAMLATFAPAVPTMETEFHEHARAMLPEARLTPIMVDGAMAALKAGSADDHNRLVAEEARLLEGFDAIVLAHFSTSRAAEAVRAVTHIPVLTSPEAAVEKMKRLVTAQATSLKVRAG